MSSLQGILGRPRNGRTFEENSPQGRPTSRHHLWHPDASLFPSLGQAGTPRPSQTSTPLAAGGPSPHRAPGQADPEMGTWLFSEGLICKFSPRPPPDLGLAESSESLLFCPKRG